MTTNHRSNTNQCKIKIQSNDVSLVYITPPMSLLVFLDNPVVPVPVQYFKEAKAEIHLHVSCAPLRLVYFFEHLFTDLLVNCL